MESWSATEEDRPHRLSHPEAPGGRSASWPWLLGAALALSAMAIGYYYYLVDLRGPQPSAPVAETLGSPEAPAQPAAEAAPAVRHPVPAEQAEPSLPTLENSDALARGALVDLLGNRAFDEWIVPAQLVRRIVATVDNLPRQTAPRRSIPLEPVPGAFVPDAANGARYTPFVRVLESVDTRALVQRYVRTYPLFQRAYEELGFPGRYFNDRLVEALDDLLAAPELAAAPELVQAKVLYEFADPELEKRSAGQKILLRMGPENAARVKAKLREIRREVAALRKPG